MTEHNTFGEELGEHQTLLSSTGIRLQDFKSIHILVVYGRIQVYSLSIIQPRLKSNIDDGTMYLMLYIITVISNCLAFSARTLFSSYDYDSRLVRESV